MACVINVSGFNPGVISCISSFRIVSEFLLIESAMASDMAFSNIGFIGIISFSYVVLFYFIEKNT